MPQRARPRVEPECPGLIAPSILRLARLIHEGKLTLAQITTPIAAASPPRLPSELVPFVTAPTIMKLGETLQAHPDLYWHPLVRRQVAHLVSLRINGDAWRQLGWQPQTDVHGIEYRPKETAAAREHLQRLIGAHAAGLFPGYRIEWKRKASRSGPKPEFKNPYPTGEPWTERVGATWLDDDERLLRERLEGHHRELKRGHAESRDVARTRIEGLVMEALENSGAAWWSGMREYVEFERPTVTTPASEPGLGASQTEILNALYQHPLTVYVVKWKPLDLHGAIDRMFPPAKLKPYVLREGAPAYLACAVLGALLRQAPERIMSVVKNHRRACRTK